MDIYMRPYSVPESIYQGFCTESKRWAKVFWLVELALLHHLVGFFPDAGAKMGPEWGRYSIG